MSITVLIADDHQMIRDALRIVLEGQDQICLVAEAGDGSTAVQVALEHSPDVALIDISMPILDGIGATRQITTALPSCRVIALTCHTERYIIDRMRKAGAIGYVIKEVALRNLVTIIEKVMEQEPSTPFSIYSESPLPQESDKYPSPDLLTESEYEILCLISQGHTSHEIAKLLSVSTRTVECHRQRIMDKVNLHNTAALISYAIYIGII